MCYILWARYPCGHTKELGHEQCAIWKDTSSFCPKLSSKSYDETGLCYSCNIETDAFKLSQKDIDNLAGIVLAELNDTLPSHELAIPQQTAAMKSLQRVTDLYSRKLQSAEKELRSLKEATAEKRRVGVGERLSMKMHAKDLESLRSKVEGFNTYWRGQIRMHEAQLEKAVRIHATWTVDRIQKKLEYAHDKWERQIEDIFKSAKEALSEVE